MATSLLKRVTTHQLYEICRSRSIAIVFVTRDKSSLSDDICEKLKKEHGQKSLSTEVTVQKEAFTNIDFFDLLARELRNSIQLRTDQHLNHNDLSSRLALLLDLGCSMKQILENVTILTFKEDEILLRARYAKDIFQSGITVEILLMAGPQNCQDSFKEPASTDVLDHHLCQSLKCTNYHLAILMKKYPSFMKIRNITPKDLNQRMDIIQQYGATVQDVWTAPDVLNLNAEKLKCRMQQLKELKDQGKLHFDKWPLNTIARCGKTFKSRIKRALECSAFIDGSPMNLETIANHLGVSEKVLKDATINFKLYRTVAIQKILYLLQQGVSAQDIVNYIYLLKHEKSQLEKAVLKCKELSSNRLPISLLLSFLSTGHIPKKTFQKCKQNHYVSALVGIPIGCFPHNHSLKPLWSSERTTIKRNFDFLTSRGFSVEDIASCLILLAHNSEGLQKYFDNLWQRPDVRPFVGKAAWKDKQRVLSLVQFLIEKDLNFRSTVLHSDEETAPDLTAESQEAKRVKQIDDDGK